MPNRKSTLRRLGATLVLCALSAVASVGHAADWSDAYLGLSYGDKFVNPGNKEKVEKKIATLQYVGGYSLGVNFFNVDMLASDKQDAAAGGGRGSHEVYVVYNNTVSLSKLAGKPVKFGPIRDVGLQAGFDFNSQNDAFGAGLTKYIVGPKVEFDLPGLLTVGVFYYKENNNNAIVGKGVSFDATARLGTVWAFDFGIGGMPVIFKGWATYTGSKGLDGFGGKTHPETWLETNLLGDVGGFAGKPKVFYLGVGYQYIRNKFGNGPSLAGTRASAPFLRFEAHF